MSVFGGVYRYIHKPISKVLHIYSTQYLIIQPVSKLLIFQTFQNTQLKALPNLNPKVHEHELRDFPIELGFSFG